jgi:hypothetical protein
MDLLITYIHHSELQVSTAPLIISTIHISPQNSLSLFIAFCLNSRSLATGPNSADASDFVITSLLPGKHPATELSHSPTNYFFLIHSTTCTQPARGLHYIASEQGQQKTHLFLVTALICQSCFCRNVFTDPLPSNECSFSR